MVSLDALLLICPNRLQLLVLHDQVLLAAHIGPRILLYAQVHVLFGVDEDLLVALLVLKAQLVRIRAVAALRTPRHNPDRV